LGCFFKPVTAVEHAAVSEKAKQDVKAQGPLIKMPVITTPSASRSRAYRKRVKASQAEIARLQLKLA